MRKITNGWLFTLVSFFFVAALLANTKFFVHRLVNNAGKKIENKKIGIENKASRLSSRKGGKTKADLFASPSNVLVNNNDGATTTSNFTQGTSSILAFGGNVVIAFDDAGSYSGGPIINFTGWAYSSDGGATFTDGGTLPVSSVGDAGEPVLARNSGTGRIYLATVGGNSPQTIQVFRSDDNAVTWMTPVNGTPNGNEEDKPWISVDNFSGTGNGNVYLMSRRFGGTPAMYFFRSTDDGATFGPSGGVLISTDQTSQGAYVAVGPDHSVYAFYYESNAIRMRKSTDQGQTFAAPVTVTSGLVGGTNGDLGLTGIRNGTSTASSFRSNEFVHVAVNPLNGNLYAVYNNKGSGADKADIFFRSSTDGGATWSSETKVNDDATTTDQWKPTIAIMPDGSGLAVFYYSRQEDPNNNLFKYYGRIGAISGATVTFQPSVAVSDVESYPEFGRDAVVNSVYMGDYDQAVATAGGFNVSWGDNRDDLAGGAPRKDPNVYFAFVPPTGLTTIPLLGFSSATLTGGNGNGTIDLGETVNINVCLRNLGSASATSITSTLSTSTPGVNITQGSSPYADIAMADSGTNTNAFTITTTSALVCGLPVQFSLAVNYGDSSKTFDFTLPTFGALGTPVTFSNNGTSPIADVGITNIPITVSGFTSAVGKTTLSLYLTHPADQDLSLSLISPDGTFVALVNNRGGTNYGSSCQAQTVFDDDAANPIAAGVAPYVGTFRPETPLSAFTGKSGASVNGNWTLQIVDNGFQTIGTFQCATLTLAPFTCPNPVVAAGSTLTSETCSPPNNAIDPGESVTVGFCLQNYFGGVNTTNLVATLENSGGVTNASGAQTYGELTPGGSSVCRDFTFTANGDCGGTVIATLQLQDGTANLGSVTYTLHLGKVSTATASFTNSSPVTIPAAGGTGSTTGAPADPYPSSIAVSGLTGTISKLTVTLNGLSHTFPSDVDMLLVAPTGQSFIMLSDVIGDQDWVNVNYTLDDDASSLIPFSGAPVSGTFKPTNYGTGDVFPAPAPSGSYESPSTEGSATFANVFNGLDPNGTWNLYVVDDATADVGSISGGWTLNITTSTLSCCSTPCILTCPKDTVVTNDQGQCGAIVNYNLPQTSGSCGTVTALPPPGSFFPFGTSTVSVSSTSGATCSFKVTVIPANSADCAITGRTSICNVETVQWCAPAGMTNYEWNGPGGFEAFTQCANVHAPGVYNVAFTDGNGCRKTCSQELLVNTCPVACTYTQGFYSNNKGKACNGSTSSISSTQLMLNAFGATTSAVFGSVANNRYFTLYKTDISDGDVFKMLPGSGNSQTLGMAAGGATYSSKNTWYLVPIPTTGSQKGKINNQLLSQLMCLWFNIQTSTALGAIDLSKDTLVTTAQTSCGSGILTGSPAKFGLPHSIVLYLNGGNGYANNVNGLFQLANDVLGGANTAVSALDAQYAVAAINNAFDGCRMLTGTIDYAPPLTTMKVQKTVPEIKNHELLVKAFPNPYDRQFSLRITSPVSGMARIQFFSASGTKIYQTQKYVTANNINILPYTGPIGAGAILYSVNVENYRSSGFVIHSNLY